MKTVINNGFSSGLIWISALLTGVLQDEAVPGFSWQIYMAT